MNVWLRDRSCSRPEMNSNCLSEFSGCKTKSTLKRVIVPVVEIEAKQEGTLYDEMKQSFSGITPDVSLRCNNGVQIHSFATTKGVKTRRQTSRRGSKASNLDKKRLLKRLSG